MVLYSHRAFCYCHPKVGHRESWLKVSTKMSSAHCPLDDLHIDRVSQERSANPGTLFPKLNALIQQLWILEFQSSSSLYLPSF